MYGHLSSATVFWIGHSILHLFASRIYQHLYMLVQTVRFMTFDSTTACIRFLQTRWTWKKPYRPVRMSWREVDGCRASNHKLKLMKLQKNLWYVMKERSWNNGCLGTSHTTSPCQTSQLHLILVGYLCDIKIANNHNFSYSSLLTFIDLP